MNDSLHHHKPMSPRMRLVMILLMGVFFGAAVAQLVDSTPTTVATVGVVVGLVVMVAMSRIFKKHPRQ
jgi:hypothetical protein